MVPPAFLQALGLKLINSVSLLTVQRSAQRMCPCRRDADFANQWSVWVNGNWRVTFRFTEAGAELVDYRDYH